MKANLTNLRKALKVCAKAHNAKFGNWSTDGQLGVGSVTPGTICDVQMICEAFYGTNEMVEVGWGYTNVWIYEVDFLPEVNENLMYMALPHGTVLS